MAKPTLEQIQKRVLGQTLQHAIPLERAGEEQRDDGTISLAITSDKPIRHWFGYLILNHAANAIRLQRMQGGAPLLLEHRRDQKIGGLSNVRTDGHVLRADAKFSRRPEAQAELHDLEDGIPRQVSGGFLLHHLVLVEQRDDDYDTYRSDDWEPFEASLVSVPADTSVGIGREFELPATTRAAEEACDDDEDSAGDASEETEADADEAEADEPARALTDQPAQPVTTIVRDTTMDELIRMGELFGEVELARDYSLAGRTLEELRTAIREKRMAAQAPPTPAPLVKLNERELLRYSISRAILADANIRDGQRDSCFELEVSQEIESRLDRSIERHGGIFIPTLHARESLQRAGLDTATSTKGQTAVFTEYGGFIELLRNKMMMAALGITILPGLQGNVGITRQTGAGTFSWVAQNPGSDVADSDLTLDLVTLTPKTGQSSTSFSRQLLAQASIAVDSLVQSDLATINALGIDKACLHGTGASNQPTGLYAQSGVNSKAFAGVITYAKVVDMETEIAIDNADIGTMAYLTTPAARGVAKKTEQFATTNGKPLWENGEMNGYRAEASSQVSSTMNVSAPTGGSEHGIAFGVWSQLLLGEWGAMELITDPYRLKKQGMIEVTSFVLVDVQLRQPTAFCKGTGQTLT